MYNQITVAFDNKSIELIYFLYSQVKMDNLDHPAKLDRGVQLGNKDRKDHRDKQDNVDQEVRVVHLENKEHRLYIIINTSLNIVYVYRTVLHIICHQILHASCYLYFETRNGL